MYLYKQWLRFVYINTYVDLIIVFIEHNNTNIPQRLLPKAVLRGEF